RETAERGRRPPRRAGPGRSPTRPPRWREDAVRRGGPRARHAPQSPEVRRTDRYGPDSVGRRATADHLDRAATRSRPARGSPRARASIPECLRSHHGRGVRPVGGISRQRGLAAFDALRRWLTPVRTPVGDSWILTGDEPTFRANSGPAAPARLLPSGDAYFLLQGDDRKLLVPDGRRRAALWTPRVWPGGVLVEGEIVGTWRRALGTLAIQTWSRISRAARDAVEAEAASLPLPDVQGRIAVRWDA